MNAGLNCLLPMLSLLSMIRLSFCLSRDYVEKREEARQAREER